MGRIADHVIDHVRERADIVEVVGRHVTLRRSGQDHWGLCPFHSEKTPSFHVVPARQIFHCFGCGEGGDVFSFRMRVEGLSFPEAVRLTAGEVGVEIAESDRDRQAPGQAEAISGANEAALAFFRDRLRGADGVAARRYLEERRVPADLVERFEIGFAPPGWDGLVGALRRAGIPRSVAERAGLIAARDTGEGHYDRFRNRVVFPIRDPSRRLLGFGGRSLDPDAPKYLNSPETPLYHKARVLFGLPQALDAMRRGDRAIVVEGYFDVLGLTRAGMLEGVAPCGTSLTAEHARRLRRYVREVILLFDGDEAGRRAAERALPLLLAEGLRVRAGFLEAGEDPASLAARGDFDRLQRELEAPPLLDRLIDDALTAHTGHAWTASDTVRRVAPHLRAIRDPVEREAYLRVLAARLGLSLEAVERAVRGGPAPAGESKPAEPSRALELDPAIRTLIGLLTAHPVLAQRVTHSATSSLPTGEARRLVERVIEAARGYGQRALAHLLSPAETALGSEAKESLLRIGSEIVPLEPEPAERAFRDCLSRIELHDLERRSREINSELGSCDDLERERALLEAKQEALRRRREISDELARP